MELEKTVSRTFNEFEDFNVGDVVRLKSGGPDMTVDNASGSRIGCVWFETIDGNQMCNGQDFHPATLEKVEKPEAS